MKKVILLMAVFTMIIGFDAKAQTTDRPILEAERHEVRQAKRAHVSKKGLKNKRARKQKIKAMRAVAKADGVVTRDERRVIKAEKRKMKRKVARKHKLKAQRDRDYRHN